MWGSAGHEMRVERRFYTPSSIRNFAEVGDALYFVPGDGSRAASTPGGLPSVVCGDFA